MVFNSYTFIFFFFAVLLLYHLPLSWRIRKSILLAASYLFYAAWNPPFVLLLCLSTVVDWFVAHAIHRTQAKHKRFVFLLISLFANLGLLGFFKYGTFVLENFVWLTRALGIPFEPATPDIILPVGISFYTFQTLSYTLDIYRHQAKPWHSFLDYALYVTFFPQLVAGPIVRATEFLPQCIKPLRASHDQFTWGISLLIVGLFEKTIVADGILAPVVELVYTSTQSPDFISAWCATVAFAGQIYCDFAGYSACAIGVALCLGFRLPDNFRFPYAAVGFSDFWRRWHISLSTWLRDYLYIPLGGNRQGVIRTQVNLMLTMLIGGLWHGASWTFVVWGGLHGLYLAGERIVRRHFRVKSKLSNTNQLLIAMVTFALVCFAWVFFRATTFEQAFTVAASMIGIVPIEAVRGIPKTDLLFVFVTMISLLMVHWMLRNSSFSMAANNTPWWVRSTILALMMLAIAVMPGEDRAFIYFQF